MNPFVGRSATPEEEKTRSEQSSRRYCRALPGYRFEFPRDHFSHPCYKVEWWYFTGNLAAESGHRFGYELTFFRVGVDNPYPNPSRWRVDDLYLAHFAISDLGNKKFFYTQRLNRKGIGLAGARQTRDGFGTEIGSPNSQDKAGSWKQRKEKTGSVSSCGH